MRAFKAICYGWFMLPLLLEFRSFRAAANPFLILYPGGALVSPLMGRALGIAA